MNKLTLLIALFTLFIRCGDRGQKATGKEGQNNTGTGQEYYGEKITVDSAVSIDELENQMKDKPEIKVKLSGVVEAVCQKKGCWMDLKRARGTSIRVTFKDYGFFMPKNCAGKTAIVEGVAKVEETSVADLKEYAKDAGKNKEEIASIKVPKKELVFEASGVILQ